jgi:putative ABC transport system permease protein
MNFTSSLKIVFQSIKNNKTRTFLTVLGIVIGVSSIIMVFSTGEGIKNLIIGQVESFGTNIIETEIRIPDKNKKGGSSDAETATAMAQGVQITTMSLEDVEDINQLPNIIDGYGAIMSQELATYKNKRKKSFLFGSNASYIDIDQSTIAQGRFFTDAEDKSLSKVVVLGEKIKDQLFGESDSLGKYIKLGKSKYRVIGVMEERGAVMTLDFDNYIYMPIRTLQKRIMGTDYIVYMVHQIENLDIAKQTAEDIRILLRKNHDIDNPKGILAQDDFAVYTMEEMMEMVGEITNYITILLLAIVAVSLVVGGVGIMNIMYVVVSERTFEIGLRKAVGANSNNILWQFLTESVIISILGSILGIILGALMSFLISLVAQKFGLDWSFIVPLESFIVAFSFAIMCGISFGVLPAKKAAQLDPILALRKDM